MSYTAKSKAASASAIPTPVRKTPAAPQSRPPVMKHPHPNDPPPLFAWLSEHDRSALSALAAISLDAKVRVQNFAALKTVFEQQNARLLPAQMDFGLTELLDYAMFEPHGCPHAYTAAVLLNLQYGIERKQPSMDLALCRDALYRPHPRHAAAGYANRAGRCVYPCGRTWDTLTDDSGAQDR